MNPFDHLVLEEPPLRLDVDAVVAQGRAQVRRRRVRAGAAMVLVTLAVAVAVPAALGAGGPDRLPTEQQRVATAPAVPPSSSAPSQGAGDAERDGVLPAVADLPFSERVGIVSQFEAAEGVWAISRIPGVPGTLGDQTGQYGRDWVQRHEYGELLLLDRTATRIVRAYPLPGVPPQLLLVHQSGVYCSRQSDGALPVSMLCRVDRNNLQATVRVYVPPVLAGGETIELTFDPEWLREPQQAPDLLRRLLACGDRACVEGQAGRAKIEPYTLELRRYADGVKAPPASKVNRTDDFGLLTLGPSGKDVLVDVDRVDMLGGDEAEAAARARDDEVSNDYYLVNDNPQLRRYRLSPEAVVWGSIRLARTVDHKRMQVEDLLRFLRENPVEAGGGTLFHLEIDNGEIISVEEQYRP